MTILKCWHTDSFTNTSLEALGTHRSLWTYGFFSYSGVGDKGLVTRLKCVNFERNEMHLFLNIREQSLTWVWSQHWTCKIIRITDKCHNKWKILREPNFCVPKKEILKNHKIKHFCSKMTSKTHIFDENRRFFIQKDCQGQCVQQLY